LNAQYAHVASNEIEKNFKYISQETLQIHIMCEEPMFLLILSLCAKHFVVFNASELVSHEPMVTTTSEKTVHNVRFAMPI